MIRLRVSTLEAFRRVVTSDYGSESELIETLRRGQWADGPATEIMRAGTVWHAALAGPEYSTKEFFFFNDVVDQAREYTGPGICELTGWRTWTIGDRLVQLEGTCDHIRGLVVTDHKTKFSTPDARDYEKSLQWRAYLLIHEAACFRYLLWHFADPTDAGYCELRGVTSFKFWPYPNMEAELVEWLGWFVDWVVSRGLLSCVEDRREAA